MPGSAANITITGVGGAAGVSVTGVGSAANIVITSPETNIAPTVDVNPVIAGTPGIGNVYTATTGTYSGNPTPTVTGQWLRDGVAIVGETGLTYTQTADDIGPAITYRETATNAVGSVQATSNALSWDPDVDLSTAAHRYPVNDTDARKQDLAGTTAASSGEPLGRVLDQIGATDLIADSSGSRPTLETVGSTVVAGFDGTATLMKVATTIAGANTVLAVLTRTAKTAGVWDGDTTTGTRRNYMLANFSGNDWRLFSGVATFAASALGVDDWGVLEGEVRTDGHTIYEDGAQIGDADYSAAVNLSAGFIIGAEATRNNSFFWDGKLAELVIFDGPMSTSERANFQAWLEHAYGADLGVGA